MQGVQQQHKRVGRSLPELRQMEHVGIGNMKVKPLILIVLDGWGMSPRTEGNAQYRAGMLNLTRFYKEYPWTELECSGLAVGLPEGQMGNSEVGHLTIGAGRIIYQELTRINSEIKSGGFFRNIAIRESMRIIREN